MNKEAVPARQNNRGPHLLRRFGLLQATALNMSNMLGIGPFITIPLLMTALGGPQALLGWIIAILIVIPDGMVWSELGAAMPGSGGSYIYLREAYGRETFGRILFGLGTLLLGGLFFLLWSWHTARWPFAQAGLGHG